MKTSKTKREYMATYEETPNEIKKREARNRARYQDEKKGLVHKGDGKEVDHKQMLDQGGSGDMGNTRVVSAAKNRSWRKTSPKAYGK
jgi:hypothetical protein